jgi:hypothetical protein
VDFRGIMPEVHRAVQNFLRQQSRGGIDDLKGSKKGLALIDALDTQSRGGIDDMKKGSALIDALACSCLRGGGGGAFLSTFLRGSSGGAVVVDAAEPYARLTLRKARPRTD